MAIESTSLAKQAFAGPDGTIKTLASQVDEHLKGNSDDVVVDVGPVFGQLNEQTVGKLDENVQIMIAGMTKSIAGIPIPERTYEKILALFSQSPLVQVHGNGISKSDSLIKQSDSEFKTDGSPDDKIVQEVSAYLQALSKLAGINIMKKVAAWFRRLVGEEIMAATNIDISVLGKVVAQSGVTAKDLSTIFKGKEHAEKSLDVAGIRYPEPGRPNFSVFRIHLTAWSDSNRILHMQHDSNGITGEVFQTDYVPRSSVMDNLKPEVRERAIGAAKGMFQ
ncbi:hypothetical protein FPRO05_02079 [Fusarium proliferatum]|uniref:Uncharacterized protein n=1 Tax=Gibberella intermedia TaxID=948311 RepID=A0A365N9A7_GIBIN|nr:hypothetical protein FPRO05_02079 [Fusarium proliferatum]